MSLILFPNSSRIGISTWIGNVDIRKLIVSSSANGQDTALEDSRDGLEAPSSIFSFRLECELPTKVLEDDDGAVKSEGMLRSLREVFDFVVASSLVRMVAFFRTCSCSPSDTKDFSSFKASSFFGCIFSTARIS